MKCTVGWTPHAELELTRMWLSANDRAALTRAVEQIEVCLATDPEHAGESRVANLRIMIEPPVGVVFSVRPDDRLVKVVEIGWARPRRRTE